MGTANIILPAMGDEYDGLKMRRMVRDLELYFARLGMADVTLTGEDFGAFAYNAQALTSGNIAITGNVTYIRFRESAAAAASFNINGGNTVTLTAGDLFELKPRSPLVSPTINWVSGAMNVFYERSS